MTIVITPDGSEVRIVRDLMAMDWEMKVIVVLVIVLLAAATAFAYGGSHVAAGMSAVVAETAEVTISEPAKLVLSGGLLLALASALRGLGTKIDTPSSPLPGGLDASGSRPGTIRPAP
ncbi:MAG: hypothetical protein H0W08_16270 [Acidobacteria bacterium]|nr:hypothetical protein [Acidobacteriota bacterium]